MAEASPRVRLLEALSLTARACQTVVPEDVAVVIAQDLLSRFPIDAILPALVRCRLELRNRLTPADIIERIDDGRPGAEEAWGAVSGATEATTLVLTEEMQQALAVAWPQMAAGDLVPARMAFLETYRKMALSARAAGLPLKWRVSLGQDPAGRLAPIRDAVAKGRLTAADARALLPAHEAATIGLPEADARRMLAEGERRAAAVVKAVPMLGSDRVTPEQIQALADSIKPKRQPAPSVDWQAEEARLQRQQEERGR